MTLNNGYGVVHGTLSGTSRDTPDNQGRWYHVHLRIDAGTNIYGAAVDVDSKKSSIGVQWKVVAIDGADLSTLTGAPEFHAIASNAGSGALDHIRFAATSAFRIRWIKVKLWFFTIKIPLFVWQPWKSGTHVEATAALEAMLHVGGSVAVWGEPFTSGFGVHNVHQNQGDPSGSQWFEENGIWQDGGVACAQPGGTFRLFVSKFSTQASATDANGHPV